ncbi:hypothetical protein K661_00263 [Piscirickettsia salmonis LF-89 = ATCC VR-1361]|nr:hypothetical protein K661_00263 [Piscirickettsia salmonis LF-89 = ATCC VR-1361]
MIALMTVFINCLALFQAHYISRHFNFRRLYHKHPLAKKIKRLNSSYH